MLGICNGFQALIKSGLLPYGDMDMLNENSPTLFRNDINRHVSRMATTRIASNSSPWLSSFEIGDMHSIAISHGEGRFVVSEEFAKELFENGQVATQYCDLEGNPSLDPKYNLNGSYYSHGEGRFVVSEEFAKELFENGQVATQYCDLEGNPSLDPKYNLNGSYYSHGEGRFVVSEEFAKELFENGQVATQYCDLEGNPSLDPKYNLNGSYYAIEGITSKDGRILGKMGHSERYEEGVFQNIYFEKMQDIFANGVNFFKK